MVGKPFLKPLHLLLVCLQCDVLNQLFVTSILIFTLTWVLLAGKVVSTYHSPALPC